MAVLDNNDQDLMQLWSLITELSEQLSQNRSVSVSLYAQAGNIKNQAVHSQTGFVFRRCVFVIPCHVKVQIQFDIHSLKDSTWTRLKKSMMSNWNI